MVKTKLYDGTQKNLDFDDWRAMSTVAQYTAAAEVN